MPLTSQAISSRETWHQLLQQFPPAHFLQTWDWGEFKRLTGWIPQRFSFYDEAGELIAAASLLTRQVGPFKVIYAPKAPLLVQPSIETLDTVLATLEKIGKRAIWLKIDPDIILARGLPPEASPPDPDRPNQPDSFGVASVELLKKRGWRYSDDQVQFRNTFYVDLTPPVETLLAGMNQSTRRKIRHAEKSGVTIREARGEGDLRTLFDIYAVTSTRQEFTIRPWEYYRQLWTQFEQGGLAKIFLAEIEGKIVGGVVLFHFGQRVWYFNGMSSNESRDYQPNYLLQWHSIQWAKAQGYQIYDAWGAPDEFIESDPMWGVYRFKDGFGGDVVRHIGAWDYVPFPPLYYAYTQIMPRAINFLRKLRR